MTRAWVLLAAIAAAVVVFDVEALSGHGRPLLDRSSCDQRPSTHTLELDRSQRGDALYRFVFSTMLGLGTYKPRAGFPHVEAGPVCTLGWKDPVAAIKIGPHVFVVKFAGKHVASVEESPA